MKKIYDLIIIGGGPAGITAGIYASRQRLKTLLITKSFGGQLARKSVEIENYPGFPQISGLDLIRKFTEHLKKFKIEIVEDSVAKVKKPNEDFFISTKGKKQFQAKTVIIASGADPRPLEVPGEKKFIGRGVSYCVACDGPLFSGKEVAVVGGGNGGFEAALSLANYAKKIYILEYNSKVAADMENQERAKKTGVIEILTNVALKEVRGGKFVESLIYQDRKTKKTAVLRVEGVFVEIGSQPATSFVKDLVEFNKKDEIVINLETTATKTPGLFAAGDVASLAYKQIVVAAGLGAQAAFSVSRYLQNGKDLSY
ncbi:MAG: FAD-dependent oxidoreductase [bacterium]